jgi:hypothetical protein
MVAVSLGPPQRYVVAAAPAFLDDHGRPSFPGPFLYYPSRRQNPSCLTAFVAFIKEWRTQQRSVRRLTSIRR